MPEHLSGLMTNLARLAIWLLILAVIFLPLERLRPIRPAALRRKQVFVDLGYYFVNGFLTAALLGVPVAVLAYLAHRLMPAAILATTASWPLWVRACAAMVVGEVGYYWAHRLTHTVPFLWRFHAIHHSAEHIDFLVNVRTHPIDIIFTRICMLAPLFALGLISPLRVQDGIIPVLVLLAGSLWGYVIHANVRWRAGPLEWLITTPGFHHWHHTNGSARDCNYASMLPWIDRLFGTHHLPKTWPERYGIDQPTAPTLLGQLVQPFQDPAGPLTRTRTGTHAGAHAGLGTGPGDAPAPATVPPTR